ncbi:hypothetical protein Clacol_001482 [Clathrus columnatus]|uniref:Nuclear pore complex protein Nup88 n=1 Tax=Clathrus columnatus TaxID=1419009 RepID=A0AAV5A121_9AGAM|nr:hypothetical protein Clacol_001482 [Clathrus columnatus]
MDVQSYLAGHPIFLSQNNFDSSFNLSFDNLSSLNRGKPLAKRNGSTIPLAHRQRMLRQNFETLYTPNVEFEIHQMALNSSGKLLAIAGRTEVAVITLPKTGYFKLVPSRLDCRTVQIGQFYHATRSASPVAKIDWHPWGKNHCTLLVMTADGVLREYDVSMDPEEPQQVLSFMPQRSHSSSFKGDSSSREIVSFCLGCGKADWGPLTVYALSKSGDVLAICPYIPHNAAYVHALDYFVRAKQENVLQIGKIPSDSNSFSAIYAQQLKYVNAIMKQLPDDSQSLFSRDSKLVPIIAPTTKTRPVRQGPFLLQPSPVEFNEGDGGYATDIFYLYSTPGSSLLSEENENDEGLGVILVTFSDGRVDVCLDVEKTEAAWESVADLPVLVVYETIDLGIVSTIIRSESVKAKENKPDKPLQMLEKNWPVIVADPIYQDTVFIYHTLGVHALNLTHWLQPLVKSMQTGVDEMIENVVKKNIATEVTIAITQSLAPHTAELSFRLKSEEEDIKHDIDLPPLPTSILESVPGLEAKDSSLISLLSREPYIPPPAVTLPETIEAIKKLGHPSMDVLKRNIVITPELLRQFATIIQRFQSYIRDIYIAVSNFQDRMILQDQEFQRQQTKYAEIVERAKRLKEEGSVRLKQRFDRCFTEQKHLLSRSDKILQQLMNASSPAPSEPEKKWFGELQRMKMEILGESHYDSGSIRARTDTVWNYSARGLNLSLKVENYLPRLRDLAVKEEQRMKELNERPVELGKMQEYRILMRLGEHKQILSQTIDKLQEMAQKLNIEIENVDVNGDANGDGEANLNGATPSYSPEFSSSEADIVLQSCDGILFKVFGRILMEASPVFRDMMSIPNPSGELPRPLVLDEDAATLELGLKFLYPIPNPRITSFDVMKDVLKMADKYFLDCILHALKALLVAPPFIDKAPLRVYALACTYGFHEEAKIASRHCLKMDILQEAELHEELSMISGRDLLRLIKLHQTRAAAILGILNGSSPSRCDGNGAYNVSGVPLWWLEFKTQAKEELQKRPLGDTIFQGKFLAACVNKSTGCPSCSLNYLSSATQARLEQMRMLIDNLADTV